MEDYKVISKIHIYNGTKDLMTNRLIKDCKEGFSIKSTDRKCNGYSIISNGYLTAVVCNKDIIDYGELL